MGYIDNIAIGSDFDGGLMDKSLDNIAKIPDLYSFLSEKGLGVNHAFKVFDTDPSTATELFSV